MPNFLKSGTVARLRVVAATATCCLLCAMAEGQTLRYPALVARFHNAKGEDFWSKRPQLYSEYTRRVKIIADTANRFGGTKGGYHSKDLQPVKKLSSTPYHGRLLTDALLSIARDLQRGATINKWLSNDELSPVYARQDDSILLIGLSRLNDPTALDSFLTALEPQTPEYEKLKRELVSQIKVENSQKIAQVTATLNLYRWIHHFQFKKYVLVNIAASSLYYYETDSMTLQMRVVTGKPKTKTPRFSTWCYEVILYPYWNVPRNIAVNEILPRVKANRNILDQMQMQVLDNRGREVKASSINWWIYNATNFPYSFRQCTGCDNSLGVVKFNLTDPFHVYMHDTNYKLAFLRNTWFLSHGCIRLEKPIDLANKLLDNRVDSNLINACITGLEPITLKIDNNVPVFVVYMPMNIVNDSPMYYKDIYRLFPAILKTKK